MSSGYRDLVLRGLLSVLREMADEDGVVLTSCTRLASDLGVGRHQVQAWVAEMAERGMIFRAGGIIKLPTGSMKNPHRPDKDPTGSMKDPHRSMMDPTGSDKGPTGSMKDPRHERERDHEKHEKHGDHETLSSVKEKHTHDHPVAKMPTKPSAKPKLDPMNDPGFVEFWTGYPRKVGKAAVAAWWSKTNPDDELLMTILEGLDAWREHWTSRETELRYIPHPMTWLNARRFDDEPS